MLTLLPAIHSLTKSSEVLMLEYQVCQSDVKCFTISIESYITLCQLAATILDELATLVGI